MSIQLFREGANVAIANGNIPLLIQIWKDSLNFGNDGESIRKSILKMLPEIAKMNELPPVDDFRELVMVYDERNRDELLELWKSTDSVGAITELFDGDNKRETAYSVMLLLTDYKTYHFSALGVLAYHVIANLKSKTFLQKFISTPVLFLDENTIGKLVEGEYYIRGDYNQEKGNLLKRQALFLDVRPSRQILRAFMMEATGHGDIDTILFLMQAIKNTLKYKVTARVGNVNLLPIDVIITTLEQMQRSSLKVQNSKEFGIGFRKKPFPRGPFEVQFGIFSEIFNFDFSDLI